MARMQFEIDETTLQQLLTLRSEAFDNSVTLEEVLGICVNDSWLDHTNPTRDPSVIPFPRGSTDGHP